MAYRDNVVRKTATDGDPMEEMLKVPAASSRDAAKTCTTTLPGTPAPS